MILRGNLTDPRQVSIFNTATGSAITQSQGGSYNLEGLSFRAASNGPTDAGHGLWLAGNGNMSVSTVNFDACSPVGSHISAQGGSFAIYGPTTISGNGGSHWSPNLGGDIVIVSYPLPSLTILNAVNISTFVSAVTNGSARLGYGSISGAANVTGSKYFASGNGVIDSSGRGTSYLPGTTAGTVASGGQYL